MLTPTSNSATLLLSSISESNSTTLLSRPGTRPIDTARPIQDACIKMMPVLRVANGNGHLARTLWIEIDDNLHGRLGTALRNVL